MRSSTFNFDDTGAGAVVENRTAPRGLQRSVPAVPWLWIASITVAATCVLLLGWELQMRHLGLRADDLGDGRDFWAVERRKVDSGPRDSVVIIGDSRILYGTDMNIWQRLTGRRPIQLARVAVNAHGFLHDLALDEHFAGLVVVGTAEAGYFNDDEDARRLLEYMKRETPSERVGHELYKEVSRYLAFLDRDYTLVKVVEQHDWPERAGVIGPYAIVWKTGETYDGRQSYFWQRLEHDAYLRGRLQQGWVRIFSGDVVTPDAVDRVIAKTRSDIDRIRARGGEVVWIRPPSAGPLLQLELRRFPRSMTWDRLLRETDSFGVHYADYALMQRLSIPDWSHLSKDSAGVFTEAYVRALLEHVDWLKRHSNIPAREPASS
jgi:hypothetical protein